MSLESNKPSSTTISRRSLFLPLLSSVVVAKIALSPRGLGSLTGAEPLAAAKTLGPANAKSAIAAAKTLVATLKPDQQRLAVIPFETEKRVDWHFIPIDSRKGLPLRDMSEPQRQAALTLMHQVLSPSGYQRALDIFAYEAILLELEGPAAAKRRDHTKYYFTLFGEPSDSSPWGLSIEGHHLSINYTFDQGTIVDSTPQFFGVNPATLKKGFRTPDVTQPGTSRDLEIGLRLLAKEEDTAFLLLNSLNPAQLKKAVYSDECPDDIQWAGEPQPQQGVKVGIQAKDLRQPQLAMLQAILDSFNANMPEEVIQQRNALIKEAGVDQIYFGWAGAKDKSGQHYYRVQGPTFIAELCNFQTDPQGNIANHIHAVWRDMTGDFNLPLAAK